MRGAWIGGEEVGIRDLESEQLAEPTLDLEPKIAKLRNAKKKVVVGASRHRSRTF